MAYSIESYKEPFWAQSGNFVRGRDPLGIQNSSVATYAALLPGLTNLTQRLRYYGMYAWLLHEYDKLPENHKYKQHYNEQYTYIRRAELILAFLMARNFPEVLSVAGSNFAHDNLEQFEENGFFKIAEGADKKSDSKRRIYWKYSSGVLGQYYAGSLMALGIIEQVSGFYHIKKGAGSELALAYLDSIGKDASALFLKRIAEGNLNVEDLETLEPMSLSGDFEKNKEGEVYLSLLVGADRPEDSKKLEPTYQRKQTLTKMLSLIYESDNVKEWELLPYRCYEKNYALVGMPHNLAEYGWYFYQLNEHVHFALETIFWALLTEMDKKQMSIAKFLDLRTKEVLAITGERNELADVLSKMKEQGTQSDVFFDDIQEDLQSGETDQAIANAIDGLLWLYSENKDQLNHLKEYAVQFDLHTKNGNALQVFSNQIESSMQDYFGDFVYKVIQNVLNSHSVIAYKKMGAGEKNLLKFIIEDNILVHVETIEPNRTSPRLKTLHNFISDLHLVDKDGMLTEKGEDLLTKLKGGTDE